ncbi:MAG: hypothetical protein V1739_02370 [Candidatus Omnitrophota bacterium]
MSKDKLSSLVKWFADKEPVYGCVLKDSWIDIGSFESLEKAEVYYRGRSFKGDS